MTDRPDSDAPDTGQTHDGPTHAPVEDDQGAALDRAAEAIHEAQDAEGSVAAHGDITSADDELAGRDSEDPDGTGGHP